MHYSFGPDTPGWKQERYRQLADELTAFLETAPLPVDMADKRRPYVEVHEAMGNQIFIRHLTDLPATTAEDLTTQADEIYKRVMA